MPLSILGIRIDTVTKQDATERARDFLSDGQQHSIFTPNPEMLVRIKKDDYFKTVLNSSSLNLCDGIGLKLATRLSSRAKPLGEAGPALSLSNGSRDLARISGADFMLDVCRLAAEQQKSVFLLGSKDVETVTKAGERLQAVYPGLRVVGSTPGFSWIPVEAGKLKLKEDELRNVIKQINDTKPDILFVGFSDGKSEKFIYTHLSELPSVKIAMGVGGAFDFIAGKVKRAPLLMRKIGLEWLYRLFKQPWRVGRIFNATVKFIFYVFIYGKRGAK